MFTLADESGNTLMDEASNWLLLEGATLFGGGSGADDNSLLAMGVI